MVDCYWPPNTVCVLVSTYCYPSNIGRILLTAYYCHLAAYSWRPIVGCLVLAAYYWWPILGGLFLAAYYWLPTSGTLQMAAGGLDRPLLN